MRIYLACDSNNDFFIDAVKEAFDYVSATLSEGSMELIFAPRRWGGDTGTIVENVRRIMNADLVLMDVTPISAHGEDATLKYNEGVMIEYGLVLAMEKPWEGSPWYGRYPKPSSQVYCSDSIPRGTLTGILNERTICSYSKNANGRVELVNEIKEEIKKKNGEILQIGSWIRKSSEP